MNTKINVGIIGLGEVAQLMHLPLLKRLSSLYSIQAVFDVSPSLCRYVQEQYPGVRISRDYQELCSSPEVDLVMILSPDQYHGSQAEFALSQGKHVFIEKPACLTKSQLELLCQYKGPQTVMVGYMRRCAPAFLAGKKLLADMPSPDHVHVQDIICEGPFFIKQTSPVFYPKDIDPAVIEEGKALRDTCLREVCGEDADSALFRVWQVLTGLSSHSLSAMRELFGMPHGVVSATLKKKGEALSIVFDYGDFCAVYQALIDNIARFDAKIEIFSDRKKISINYDTPYIRNLPASLFVEESSETETSTLQKGPYYKDPFQNELELLHEHLTQGTKPKTGLEDSLEDFILFEQIMAALKKGMM